MLEYTILNIYKFNEICRIEESMASIGKIMNSFTDDSLKKMFKDLMDALVAEEESKEDEKKALRYELEKYAKNMNILCKNVITKRQNKLFEHMEVSILLPHELYGYFFQCQANVVHMDETVEDIFSWRRPMYTEASARIQELEKVNPKLIFISVADMQKYIADRLCKK